MNKFKRFALRYAPMFVVRHAMRSYEGKLKQILILRTDLKMRRGKEIAQGAHASMGGYLSDQRDPFVRMWLDGAFAKIAVGIDSEEELIALYQKAQDLGVVSYMIKDSGRTEFNGVETLTSVSVGPGDPEIVRELTGHLKLR